MLNIELSCSHFTMKLGTQVLGSSKLALLLNFFISLNHMFRLKEIVM